MKVTPSPPSGFQIVKWHRLMHCVIAHVQVFIIIEHFKFDTITVFVTFRFPQKLPVYW